MEIFKKEMSDEEKQKILEMSEISLILDTYDDMFSSFDPRPYSQRALSEDFLSEAKSAARDKPSGQIELKLIMPANLRNLSKELVIKKRLKEHFIHHFNEESKKLRHIKLEGLRWFGIGTIFILIATYLYEKEGFIFRLLQIMAEPAGWFSFWEGLAKIFITAKERAGNHHFYEKMSKAEVNFTSY